MQIEDHNLKKIALLNLVSSAEDNRNKLMLSQTSNVKLLKEQPKDFWGKFLKGEKEDLKKKYLALLKFYANVTVFI